MSYKDPFFSLKSENVIYMAGFVFVNSRDNPAIIRTIKIQNKNIVNEHRHLYTILMFFLKSSHELNFTFMYFHYNHLCY